MRYFLGADLGSTKTHVAIAAETGVVVGFGKAGSGNHQVVGHNGMLMALQDGLAQALKSSGLAVAQLDGAGFGIAGYDWPADKPALLGVINQLGLPCAIGMVNDAVPGLIAAAQDGWGVSLISGTGCNCRGRDQTHEREGRVTGYGYHMGEFAGASELVWRAMQAVSYAWTLRGPQTALTAAFITYAGAKNLADLIEGYTTERYHVGSEAARLVFEVARQGDEVARALVQWAGVELAEMAKAVIRQLQFETLTFDVVLSGSMFAGGPLLIEPMWATISRFAPGARLVHLTLPPVMGAIILGMEQGRLSVSPEIRGKLAASLEAVV